MVKKIIVFLQIILFNPKMIITLITGFDFKLGLKRQAKGDNSGRCDTKN